MGMKTSTGPRPTVAALEALKRGFERERDMLVADIADRTKRLAEAEAAAVRTDIHNRVAVASARAKGVPASSQFMGNYFASTARVIEKGLKESERRLAEVKSALVDLESQLLFARYR